MTETELRQKLSEIHKRNRRVEKDKKWETSWFRRIFIAVVTYLTASLWLLFIHDSLPFLKALVPTGGYILSTLSLPFIKKWWIKQKYGAD